MPLVPSRIGGPINSQIMYLEQVIHIYLFCYVSEIRFKISTKLDVDKRYLRNVPFMYLTICQYKLI